MLVYKISCDVDTDNFPLQKYVKTAELNFVSNKTAKITVHVAIKQIVRLCFVKQQHKVL